MKRAIKVPEYSDVSDFKQPSGVVDVQLDKNTNRVATPSCPETYSVAFVSGTEPKDTCDQISGDHRGLLSRILGIGNAQVAPPPVVIGAKPVPAGQSAPVDDSKKPKKGFFGKIAGIFKDDKSEEKPAPPTQPRSSPPPPQ